MGIFKSTIANTGNIAASGSSGVGQFGYTSITVPAWPGVQASYPPPWEVPDLTVNTSGKIKVVNPLIRWLNQEEYLCLATVDDKSYVTRIKLIETPDTKMFYKPAIQSSFEIKTKLVEGKIIFWATDKDNRVVESDNLDAVVGGVML